MAKLSGIPSILPDNGHHKTYVMFALMKLCESVIDAMRRLKPRGANRHMKIQFFLKGAHCSFQLIDILHSIAFENIGACKNSKSFLS